MGSTLAEETPDRLPIRRALLSVYDKTGIAELAAALSSAGVELISTGSTAATIDGAGIPVTPVEQITGFPECLGGRVKTLHPAIHAGILANRREAAHLIELEELAITPIDLVVGNLYPFAETVASAANFAECIEQIDIGGPTMVRAAAKNHADVAVVTNPADYPLVQVALKKGGFSQTERRQLAAAAFAHTASYDAQVSAWFAQQVAQEVPAQEAAETAAAASTPVVPPEQLSHHWQRQNQLRYGENPHQQAAVYQDQAGVGVGIAQARQLQGKEMSFNNYTDGDAAWRAAYDHEAPCVAIIKHANPCGIAIGTGIAQAHRRAHACDPLSAFGGVVAANRRVDAELAQQLVPIFTEVLIAPEYAPEALEILAKKKNLRVLVAAKPERGGLEFKAISGGLLVQERDDLSAGGDSTENWTLVAGTPADEQTLADLKFSWRAVRAVRSNAILLGKDGATVGVGMGQVNRVDAARLAVERANTLDPQDQRRSHGAVAASDAFFPFPDGAEVLMAAGVRAIVQPGGSIRDEQVIAAAKEAGITMYLTGVRHFSH